MLHTVLELRVSESIARHMVELIGPSFLKLTHFTACHDNGTSQGKNIILKEFELLKHQRGEDFAVVREIFLKMLMWSHTSAHSIISKQDTLALKVSQDIIKRDELNLPSQLFQHVFFHCDEVIVAEWETSILQKLLDTGVSLFEVLC